MNASPKRFQRKLARLVPGQLVGVANCRDIGTVVRREGPNLYLVSHPAWAAPVLLNRYTILTYVLGAWRPLADASDLAPHVPIGTAALATWLRNLAAANQ